MHLMLQTMYACIHVSMYAKTKIGQKETFTTSPDGYKEDKTVFIKSGTIHFRDKGRGERRSVSLTGSAARH